MKHRGQCGCGGLVYEFVDEPINTAFCYCKDCQKTTGTDKWFGLWVPSAKFEFIKGSPLTYTRRGKSGKDVHHHFCPDCASVVCAKLDIANLYSVAGGTLDKSDNYAPLMAIYTASAPSWAVFPEGVPKYDELPPEFS